tara:strand:+ start:26 stop:229 length:204 start_codon:yes stop_codon:yes gene_type:complete
MIYALAIFTAIIGFAFYKFFKDTSKVITTIIDAWELQQDELDMVDEKITTLETKVWALENKIKNFSD